MTHKMFRGPRELGGRTMSRRWKLFVVSVVCLATLLTFSALIPTLFFPDLEKIPHRPFKQHRFIAHALGAIDRRPYTNTWEAFLESYQRGIRVFEVDFVQNQDGDVFCFHPGLEHALQAKTEISNVSRTEFEQSLYYQEYKTLTAVQLALRLREYPDTYLVTDTKGSVREILGRVVRIFRQHNPNYLDHIVPQIYAIGLTDLYQARKIYPFQHVIYTLYRGFPGPEWRVASFAKRYKISAVTMPHRTRSKSLIERLAQHDIPVFVHTLNGPDEIRACFEDGVHGIYTDFATPADFTSPTD